MNSLLERDVKLYDFERICTDAVRYTNMHIPSDKNRNVVFRVVAEFSGLLSNRIKKNLDNKSVENEVVEFRLHALSNYKKVFIKFSEELYKYFFDSLDKNGFQEYRYKYQNDNWYLAANHDSCWTEGFNVFDYFDYDSTFRIKEIGLGYIELNENIEWLEEIEPLLLGELKEVHNWEVDTSSHWNMWYSFMKSIQKENYVKGFRLQFTRSENDKFYERNVSVYFNSYNDIPIMVSYIVNERDKKIKIYVNPFTPQRISKLFPKMKLNFISDAFYNFSEYLGQHIRTDIERGYEVEVKQFK